MQTLPFLVGTVGMVVSDSFWVLLVSRTVAGLGVGLASTLCNLYISEVAPADVRGKFGAWAPFSVTFGILVSYILAWACTKLFSDPGVVWRVMLGAGGVPAAAGLCMAGLLVESPRWLMQQGRLEDARVALTLLYKETATTHSHVQAEAMKLHADLQAQAIAQSADSSAPSPMQQLFFVRSNWRPLLIGVVLNVLQQVCGINVVVYFAPTVLVQAGFSKTASILLTAGVGVAQLVATYVLMQLVDRVGRRPLNFIGLGAMVASLVVMALAFASGIRELALSKWLAVGGMLVFRVAFSLSLGPLPYIITPEVFQSSVRPAGAWCAPFCGTPLSMLTLLASRCRCVVGK